MEEKIFKDLLLLGHDIIEEAGQDTAAGKIATVKPENEDFYSGLLQALMNLSFPESEAKAHWKAIVKHKWHMSEQLKRNVGIRVAALDYFQNIKGLVKKPKIVELSEFADISWKAVTDSLTGLYNHRYFQNAVNTAIKNMLDEETLFSVLMLDLDFFKIYNDSNGHVAGDVVIVEVANIIKAASREQDTASRYGGEEFAMVLPGADKAAAHETAENIRQKVLETNFANEEIMPLDQVTLSGGVASAPRDGRNRRDIVSAADSRLYRAKRNGRNQVCAD